MAEGLAVTLRTPHAVVFDGALAGLRVGTATGQVGLRPGGEPLVTVVEPGLILLRRAGGVEFAASAGGLLEFDGERCTLYTPFAAVGPEAAVRANLERVLATPDGELTARRRLGELEQRIVREVTERDGGARERTPRGGGGDGGA